MAEVGPRRRRHLGPSSGRAAGAQTDVSVERERANVGIAHRAPRRTRSRQGPWRDRLVLGLVEASGWLWRFDPDAGEWWLGDYEGFRGWWWWGLWGGRAGWWFVDPITGHWRRWADMH